MNSKLIRRILITMIVVTSAILIISTSFVTSEIKIVVNRSNKMHNLEQYVWAFDEGDYYRMYIYTMENENLNIDDNRLAEYELFSKYYNALTKYHVAKINNKDTSEYIGIIERIKSKITWKHVLDKIDELNLKYGYEGV